MPCDETHAVSGMNSNMDISISNKSTKMKHFTH